MKEILEKLSRSGSKQLAMYVVLKDEYGTNPFRLDGPTRLSLRKVVGVNSTTFSRLLMDLVRDGVVEKTGWNKYRVKEVKMTKQEAIDLFLKLLEIEESQSFITIEDLFGGINIKHDGRELQLQHTEILIIEEYCENWHLLWTRNRTV
jgi:hypothetical protein